MHGDAFLAGLLIGVVVGLLLAPVLRWAMTVREWREASREAGLADEVLERMAEEEPPAPARTAGR